MELIKQPFINFESLGVVIIHVSASLDSASLHGLQILNDVILAKLWNYERGIS